MHLLREPPAERLGERTFSALIEILIAELAGLVEHAPGHGRPGQTVLWQSVCDYLSEHWSDPRLSRKGTADFFSGIPITFPASSTPTRSAISGPT